ncbi:hypothetical protein [Herbaspirillum sp. RV1423]|uniref:hypothetical protein n=1 Tax=Herbaspirillum sp. RV1423 TaxID=1443993 RepID=UPI0004B7B158|nr:hypothetical protein [Herbaspirillum sp. RV1423]
MQVLSTNAVNVGTLSGLLYLLQLYQTMTRKSDDEIRGNDIHGDISATAVDRLLSDLIEMTGQASISPRVLELQIGEIFTRTAVERGAEHFLSVTASLPKCEQPHYLPLPVMPPAATSQRLSSVDFLWHADEGRYIVVRKIPLGCFSDERSVMDAILETADIAGEYLIAVQSGQADNPAS